MAEDRVPAPIRVPRQNSDYFASSRPRLASVQSPPESPSSPRTPGRPLLFSRQSGSNYNSPGVTFRVDDEVLVFEFNSISFKAGIGGEERPRSIQRFGPAEQARVGDYTPWLPMSSTAKRRRVDRLEDWGMNRELWQMDLRDVDLGLVEDRIERAVRTSIRDELLVQDESKRRSFTVSIPPLLPQPLLATLLKTLFNQCPAPTSITLLSQPTLCTISAGLRSALVVDIGWQETVVTVIYEYREVQYRRSSRALKLLSWETRNMLMEELARPKNSQNGLTKDVTFEDVEEVLTRMVWTQNREEPVAERKGNASETEHRQMEMEINLASLNAGKYVRIPFQRFSDPVETALLGASDPHEKFDDDDLPLPALIYRSLLSLPVDTRGICAQRILLTGDGSEVLGLKRRLLEEVSSLISTKGWDLVHNYGSGKPRPPPTRVSPSAPSPPSDLTPEEANKDMNPESSVPAHLQPQLPDAVLAKIQDRAQTNATKHAPKDNEQKPDSGETKQPLSVRGLRSLGPWAGASMVAGLRVRGLVEIERERFLQYGLAGGDDKKRQSMAPQQSAAVGRSTVATPGPGIGKASRTSWSLGVWA